MLRKFAAVAAIAAFVATPALAADASVAQLGAVKGSVLVNAKTASASALKAGDRVVASKGSAQVKFADGCVVDLKANSMVTVGAKSPCAAGAGVVSATSAQTQQMWGMSPFVTATATFLLAAAVVGVANDQSSDSP